MKIKKPVAKLTAKENIIGFKYIKAKITDTDESISKGGRAHRWWLSKTVKKSDKFMSDGYNGNLEQFEIMSKYMLRGFEYGNWVNNNDRHLLLEATAESMDDLSKIMGTKNIGLDYTVGIAFGARGKGGKGAALAHFEPSTFMINLTKEKGFGSLAHEYGHALDYFFGMYIDQDKDSPALSGGMSTVKKVKIEGGILRRQVNEIINSVIMHNGELTDSYKRLQDNYFGQQYWFRRNEIFARLFEQWVRYKMDGKGIKNTFLSKKKYEANSYLLPKDFNRVAPKMDLLIREMAAFMNNKKTALQPITPAADKVSDRAPLVKKKKAVKKK